MTEPELSNEQRTAQLLADADKAMAQLRSRVESVKQAQAQALHATGDATSNDGSVHAVVDSTGVVTSLRFAHDVFEQTSPDRLAQTVVATIQSAAAKARGRMSEALAPVRGDENSAQVSAGLAQLGLQRATVPDVPRTAADPTAQQDAWAAPRPEQPRGPEWGAIAPDPTPVEPMRAPAPSNRRRHTDQSDGPDDFTDERPW